MRSNIATPEGHLHGVLFDQLARAARKNFLVYLLLNNIPGGAFRLGKLHEFLATTAQEIVEGKRSKRTIFNLPPQHGKSTMLSKEFVSWLIGYRPGVQMALTGFSHSLVTDFSKWVRDRVESPKYRAIFPDVKVKSDFNKSDAWTLNTESGVRAHSVGKKLTGRTVDVLIVDDPHSGRQEAESPTQRKRVREWYLADCMTRLSPGAIVLLIGTRWHREDLSGFLTSPEYEEEQITQGLSQELFTRISLPAFALEDDPLGRAIGEPLFPEVRGTEFLQSVRAAMPDYEWESQYMQNPMTAGSGQVDATKLVRISMEDVPRHVEWVRGWDLAVSESQTSDYSAGALCAYDRANDLFYIADMWHNRTTWPKLKPEVVRVSLRDRAEWGVHRIGVEGVSGFKIGFHELQKSLMGEVKVELKNPGRHDKLVRAQPWLNKVEAGKVRLVRGSWNREFLNELNMFPDGTHDDQVDTISICWELFHPKTILFA